jgi:uncharacterized protein Veg
MFVKPLSKYNKTTKEHYSLYQLCESFRLDGCVRQRVIFGLGNLDELPTDAQKMRLGKRIEEMLEGKHKRYFAVQTKMLNVYRVIFITRYLKSNARTSKVTNRIFR